MACRAAMCSSSHGCLSLLYPPLPLLFWSVVSLDLVSSCHTFLSVTFLYAFSFCSRLVPFPFHFHFQSLLPSFLFFSQSKSVTLSLVPCLPHTYSLSYSLPVAVAVGSLLGMLLQGAWLPWHLHVGKSREKALG